MLDPHAFGFIMLLCGLMWLLMRSFGDHGMRMPRCPRCGGEGSDNHAPGCEYEGRW